MFIITAISNLLGFSGLRLYLIIAVIVSFLGLSGYSYIQSVRLESANLNIELKNKEIDTLNLQLGLEKKAKEALERLQADIIKAMNELSEKEKEATAKWHELEAKLAELSNENPKDDTNVQNFGSVDDLNRLNSSVNRVLERSSAGIRSNNSAAK